MGPSESLSYIASALYSIDTSLALLLVGIALHLVLLLVALLFALRVFRKVSRYVEVVESLASERRRRIFADALEKEKNRRLDLLDQGRRAFKRAGVKKRGSV